MDEAARGLASTVSMLYVGYGEICKGFYRKFGKEALPVISEVMREGGDKVGKIMRESLPSKSMKTICQQDMVSDSMFGWGLEVVELTDDTSHVKMPKCPLGLEGTSRELCESVMVNDLQKATTFLGKKVNMKIIKSVAAGDEKCEIVFSTKKISPVMKTIR
jgi:hypothetical protein